MNPSVNTTSLNPGCKKRYAPRNYPLLNKNKHLGFMTDSESNIWSDKWTKVGKSRRNSDESLETTNDSSNWMYPSVNENKISSTECNSANFNHEFKITTNYSISNKEYISVEKVFYYVTLGGIISNHDMLEVNEWVEKSVNAVVKSKKQNSELEKVFIRVSRPFDGVDNIYHIKRYLPIHYSAIAKGCINWAVLNSSKIIYPRVNIPL